MLKKIFILVLFCFLITQTLGQPRDSYVYRVSIPTTSNPNVYKLNQELNGSVGNERLKIYRKLGLEYYDMGLFETAHYFLDKSKGYKEEVVKISDNDVKDMKSDEDYINNLPKDYSNVKKDKMEELATILDGKIDELIKQRDEIKNRANVNQEVLNAKENTIKILGKEKNILSITIQKENIKIEKDKIKNYLNWLLVFVSLLVLVIIVLIQKKSIKVKDSKIEEQIMDINKKNTYLEHAARIIRHDMHSGINTYIPRGLTSLEKRVSPEDMKNLNIEGSIKMIREGLNHTQKVYKSVYEFTNLVKQNVVLDKIEINIKDLISKNIVNTSYSSNVYVKDLPTLLVNETLFWNAIDSLIKNGLKYNKSEIKEVNIYMDGDDIVVQDNGIGMDKEKFETIIKQGSGGEESGLGLNICLAILKEHNFNMTCEKLNVGTKIKIKVK